MDNDEKDKNTSDIRIRNNIDGKDGAGLITREMYEEAEDVYKRQMLQISA